MAGSSDRSADVCDNSVMRIWQGMVLYDRNDLIAQGKIPPGPPRRNPGRAGNQASLQSGSVFNSLPPDLQLRVVRELARDLAARQDAAPQRDASWNSAAARESGSGSAFWSL